MDPENLSIRPRENLTKEERERLVELLSQAVLRAAKVLADEEACADGRNG